MKQRVMSEEEYEKHQAKVKRSYWAIQKSELENLPVKRPTPNRSSKMTPEQREKYEKEYLAKYGRMPRGPDKRSNGRPKYGNEAVIEDGIRMASRKEMRRYRELGLLLKAGEINWLARQVRFILQGGIEYVADFVYGKAITGDFSTEFQITVEDTKSEGTIHLATYRMKKKLIFAKYGIDIQEV